MQYKKHKQFKGEETLFSLNLHYRADHMFLSW